MVVHTRMGYISQRNVTHDAKCKVEPPMMNRLSAAAGNAGLFGSAFIAAIATFGALASDADRTQPLPSHSRTSLDIIDRLRDGHFIRKPLDDQTSSQMFENYLDLLDARHQHFTARDIAAMETYRLVLDDALRKGDVEPAFAIYNRYRQRALERVAYEETFLDQGFEQLDFTADEVLEIDRSEAPVPATRAELEDLWRLDLKSRVLSAKLAGKSLEEIDDALSVRIKNRARSIRQTRSEDVFQSYINAFALTYDEHTQYFSPRDSEDFGIFMSLSLEGIGAVLETRNEYTIVRRLVKGGPADKGGQLKPEDRIIAVGQSEKEPFVDIVGWRSDDVVQLIRGPKGSPVRLKIIPAGLEEDEIRIVQIVREAVNLVEQSASKSVLTLESGGREHRVGIIVVPTFYVDFKAMHAGDSSYKSTTRDAARLIRELKEEHIDALIVDVRNNGGGSLQEAVELTGLFVESGPVVQVKSLRGRPRVLRDRDESVVWQGPLAVMVNRYSASASEIFAGAIQDYDLGIVVGSRTFGKGTVQTLIDLPRRRGQLKVTERQFYRVSGVSTHYNGIVPDIAYPTPEDLLYRERRLRGAIDSTGDVAPTGHASANRFGPVLARLRSRHEARTKTDPDFAYLKAKREYIEHLQERTVLSLSESTRLAEKDADDAWDLRLENDRLIGKGEEPVANMEELADRDEPDTDEEPAYGDDILVRETANILIDYIGISTGLALADGAAKPVIQ